MVRGVTADIRFQGYKSLIEVVPVTHRDRYKRIYSAGEEWLKSLPGAPVSGLFLSGKNGSGKSSFAAWLLKSLGRGIRMTMIEAQEMYFENWKVPQVLLGPYLVVVDEVGKEYATKNGHSEMVLEHVVKFRSERKYPTVLISNGDIGDVARRYGPTVESVLEGRYLSIPFPEYDIRVATGKSSKDAFIHQCREKEE